ncbi:MAG: acyl-CoA dehydrogenase [Candidatus Binatia bacterium]|nr:MAG: acyl-CoA dehydrogenase [Candidatus Binatia bacterium]
MALFTPAHEEFRRETRALIESELAPRAAEFDDPNLVRSYFRKFGAWGWLGLSVPKEYGGRGGDFAYDVVLGEEIPRARTMGLALSIAAHSQFVIPYLLAHGTAAQKNEIVPELVRGEKIAGIAATEPTGGTDLVRAVRCTAVDDGDFWVISGEKKFTTNGPIADYILALVRTSAKPGSNSFSLILVPTNTPGFEVSTLRTMGMRSSPTGWLKFRECRVPKSLTIGKPHLGFLYMMSGLQRERLIASVSAVGLADLVLQETMARARARMIYERPLSELQAVRHRIAEMAAELESNRRFVRSVAESYRDGRVEGKEICMIKYHVMESVQRIVAQCMQLHGGEGFLDDHWISRAFRDTRVFTIGGGVSEAMKDLVAGYLRL